MSTLAPPYRPRQPHSTVLYGVVRRHLETFLAFAHDTYDAPLPKYVRDELRRYLRCGDFAQGFTRAHCDACGHDLLVAFSCKSRGACPSCAGRRMANTAAHLVDRVFPSVPVRQWVLSLPFQLRARAAFDAKTLTLLVRAFADALGARHRAWSRDIGIAKSEFGAVTFVQRFGSSLNLNVHFHVVVIDGVFSRNREGDLLFTAAPPPTRAEMFAVVDAVRVRADEVLRRETDDKQLVSHDPLERCAQIALTRGDVRALGDVVGEPHEELVEAPRREGDAVDADGFNLEASVRIEADDDFGREHLLRYCARPPLSLARLTALPGGKLAYRIKKLRSGRAKVRVLTPLELLARLAALVPPPRHPLVRFHGVLAPRSSWRRDVIPKPRERKQSHHHTKNTPNATPPQKSPTHGAAASRALRSAALVPKTERLTPNVISVTHWDRLRSGALLASSPRVDWAMLLRRTFDVDVLECPTCHGRLRLRGIVEDPEVVHAILTELKIQPAPTPTRARDPTSLTPDQDAPEP